MSEFQICACGSAPGYPHRPDCPRPLYNPTDAQFEQWEKDWLNIKTQHTSVPWQACGCTIYQADKWENGNNVGRRQIARVYPDPEQYPDEMPSSEDTANTQFIVRACNAHDELLDACKTMLAWMQNCALDTVTTLPNAVQECAKAKTAIAKATSLK